MQILLTLAYDGTNYCGWQMQKNGVSVQQVLEQALAVLVYGDSYTQHERIVTTAASRTDAGVHALGQRVAFDGTNVRIPTEKLPQVLNGLLPADISVQNAQTVPDNFNPRFDARCKAYAYRFYNAPVPNPLRNRYSAHVPQALDLNAMQRAASFFIGRHDFAAFCAAGGSAKTTVREVLTSDVTVTENEVIFTVTGNAFLYNMVRIMAGTLLYVGLGKIRPDEIPAIIASRKRTRAGKTMPPQGLTLAAVEYHRGFTPESLQTPM